MMDSDFSELDEFEFGLQEEYAHLFEGRQNRRERRPRTRIRESKLEEEEMIQRLGELTAAEGELTITYSPSLHEEGWLLGSMAGFFQQEFITDVLYLVKGGKEANVYCCAAYPGLGVDYLAAKVYRPHMFRQIRNDAVYRQGRYALDNDGNAIVNDKRSHRAMKNRSNFGRKLQRVSWLMHEYRFLEELESRKAAVPKPWFSTDNAILMDFIGDGRQAAPTLNQIRLSDDEVVPLYNKVLGTIDTMLDMGYVHGDLSAFNILYWQGDITVIDFPQVIDIEKNPSAIRLFQRDVDRVCDYFRKQGMTLDSGEVADKLREKYGFHTRYDE